MGKDQVNKAGKGRTRSPSAKARPTAATKTPQVKAPPKARASDGPVAVVGIGASAGGLDALKDFFNAMPSDSGMTMVVVQHLEPAHESQMAEILAKHTTMPVAIQQIAIQHSSSQANVTVELVPGQAGEGKILAIILEDAPHRKATRVLDDDSALAQLESENRSMRAELEDTNQEHESASEELETSQEELQSINEELNTVNNQLSEKVGELTDANNDLANLTAATEIATVFLDSKLLIKQFTPRATELLNLIASDVGRPISHITQNFDGKNLSAAAHAVIKGLVPAESEVRISDGRWYTMRILPYRTLDNRIDGAVVTFTDVSRLKLLEHSILQAKIYAESIIATIREPLLVLDSSLRIVSANPAYHQIFKTTANATSGEFLHAVSGGQWNLPELRRLLETIGQSQSEFKDLQVERDFPALGHRIVRLNARQIKPVDGQPALILLAIEDVTEREQARSQIELHAAELEKRVQQRTADLANTIEDLEGEVRQRLDAAEALRQSEQRHRSLVEATAQIVWTTNAQGEVTDDIPAWRAFTGQGLAEIQGQGWASALHPDDRQPTEALWSHAVKLRSPYETQYRIRRSDGQYRHFAVRGVPVVEPDGSIHEWVGTCTDITDRKMADEHLKALNVTLVQRASQLRALATELTLTQQKERKRLALTLHDGLQQLLVGTRLGIGSIIQKNNANRVLVKNLAGLNDLLGEALQVCRSLAVELSPPVLSEVGLSAAIKWLGDEMKRIHGLEVRVTGDTEIPADAGGVALLLFHAVRELLFNVVKHAGVKSAKVQIGRPDNRHVQIEVTDDGVGFVAVAPGLAKDSASGMGLFGVQERIAHMGGRMDIESSPGKGTRARLFAEIKPASKGR
jgi:PAS domain S-box-containing protein